MLDSVLRRKSHPQQSVAVNVATQTTFFIHPGHPDRDTIHYKMCSTGDKNGYSLKLLAIECKQSENYWTAGYKFISRLSHGKLVRARRCTRQIFVYFARQPVVSCMLQIFSYHILSCLTKCQCPALGQDKFWGRMHHGPKEHLCWVRGK